MMSRVEDIYDHNGGLALFKLVLYWQHEWDEPTAIDVARALKRRGLNPFAYRHEHNGMIEALPDVSL